MKTMPVTVKKRIPTMGILLLGVEESNLYIQIQSLLSCH